MCFLLDTNIFILSIYEDLFLKATKKFIKNNKDPLPFSLNYEIKEKIDKLIILFQKISFDVGKGKQIIKNKELKILKRDFANIYHILHHKSNNFANENKLIDILIKSIENLYSISSWFDSVKYYPQTKSKEKEILKNNKKLLRKLERIKGIHYADLKILCIANEYAKDNKNKTKFVTRDKGILNNKDILEESFEYILIKKVSEYI